MGAKDNRRAMGIKGRLLRMLLTSNVVALSRASCAMNQRNLDHRDLVDQTSTVSIDNKSITKAPK